MCIKKERAAKCYPQNKEHVFISFICYIMAVEPIKKYRYKRGEI